jgi:hypothetical protein
MFAALLAAFFAVTVLQRSQHSDPLAQLPMLLRFLQRSFAVTVLQRVSTLILWQLPMFAALLAAFAAVHCVAEVSL